jgi:hypothetical protein
MSWWTDVRDTFEKVATGGLYDPWKSRQADRDQRDMVNAQIKAYQDQTALARQQLDEARNATDAEKRRVNEKQIRTLRRNYRAQGAGLLGVGQPANQDMDAKLGG